MVIYGENVVYAVSSSGAQKVHLGLFLSFLALIILMRSRFLYLIAKVAKTEHQSPLALHLK